MAKIAEKRRPLPSSLLIPIPPPLALNVRGSLTIAGRKRSEPREFPQNSREFGEEGGPREDARRCSPCPNDSSFYNLEFLSERPNYRRTKGLLLLHAAADSVETWLYFSQSVSLRSSSSARSTVRVSLLRGRGGREGRSLFKRFYAHHRIIRLPSSFRRALSFQLFVWISRKSDFEALFDPRLFLFFLLNFNRVSNRVEKVFEKLVRESLEGRFQILFVVVEDL